MFELFKGMKVHIQLEKKYFFTSRLIHNLLRYEMYKAGTMKKYRTGRSFECAN